MSDACNQAQKMSQDLADEVATAAKAKIGADEWAKLSATEQAHQTRCLRVFCHNHLRNTALRHAVKHEGVVIKGLLSEKVKDIPDKYRVSTNFDALVRATCKEFVYMKTNVYAKGQGMNFLAWTLKNYPSRIVVILQRADRGSRQDICTEGAVAALLNLDVSDSFIMRKNLILTFLSPMFSLYSYIFGFFNRESMLPRMIISLKTICILCSHRRKW